MKVWLPGVTGTLSVHYLFILAAGDRVEPAANRGARKSQRSLTVILVGPVAARNQCTSFSRLPASSCRARNFSYVYHSNWPSQQHLISVLFCASIAYFLSNTGAVGLIIALTEGKTFRRVWMENFFWTAPHYILSAGHWLGLFHYWNQRVGWQGAVLVFPAIYLIYHSYRLYLGRLAEEKRHVGEIADLHLRTIQALALAIDARDGTTHQHLQRVQVYARELARELNLPKRIGARSRPRRCSTISGSWRCRNNHLQTRKTNAEEFEKNENASVNRRRDPGKRAVSLCQWYRLCGPTTKNGMGPGIRTA